MFSPAWSPMASPTNVFQDSWEPTARNQGWKSATPWSYYHKFWQAHGLDHLANIVPTEISIGTAPIRAELSDGWVAPQ